MLLMSGFILVLSVSFISSNREDNSHEIISEEHPNIIFVFADQWRAQELGYAGNKQVITPNLDKLAAESLVFENAISIIPVCSPWRASFLTGQYPLTHGIFYNDKPLPTEAETLGKIYKREGYQTGYIGKWHLNGHQRGEDPFSGRDKPVPKERRQGFDYWKVREVSHNYNDSFYFDEKDRKQQWEGYDVFPQTDSAISFIQKNKENPFLLVLSYGPPHDPYFSAPQQYRDMYDPKNIQLRANVPLEFQDSARNVIAGYYAHCTAIDKAIGDLLESVERAGLTDNTIIVFTSEHGDMLMSKGVLKKQRPYDESIKVPMLIRFPQKLGKTRRNILDPIGTPDLLPTLLGLSGLEIPSTVEGKNFASQLLDGKDLDNEAVLITLPVPFHEWQFLNGGREYRGIRTRKYTYVRDLKGPWLMYDNEKDPFQLFNLANQSHSSTIQNELEGILQAKLREVKDEFLPADEYMTMWNYLYDRTDSLRPNDYLEKNR